MFADMHIHSIFSDSTLSSLDIISKAINLNLSMISVCDHHNYEIYKELVPLCKEYGINYIYGVEINAYFNEKYPYVHILAYNFDPNNTDFIDLLISCNQIYDNLSLELIKQCANKYTKINEIEYSKFVFTGTYGGWKAYEYLLVNNVINNLQDYFSLFTSFKIPYAEFPTVEYVIDKIKNANGVAILAHPGNSFDNIEYENILNEFFNLKIDGVECFYPLHDKSVTDFCVKFCKDNSLLITGGSDDHGHFLKNLDQNDNTFKIRLDKLVLR